MCNDVFNNDKSISFVTHKRSDGSFQALKDHLLGVAKLSAGFAKNIGSPLEGYRTGLLHDIGKYSLECQRRQRDPEHTPPTDHSSAGVRVSARKLHDIPAAFAIAGHHGGLPDKGMDAGTIGASLNKQLTGKSDPSAWQSEIKPEMLTDIPAWVTSKVESVPAAMYTRMLFSCLVDADYLDTEAALQGTTPRGGHESIPALYDKLKRYVAAWLQSPRDELCERRNRVLEQCLLGGRQSKGLYTLTVPTGGGKTVSSLAFALSHAAEHNMERVIYVIPYTGIIEQTVEVFSYIIGSDNVLEHHSQVESVSDATDSDDMHSRRRMLACENWDAPVIVTTAVQFFESMYASKPSRCRKLHNIANSVIVFDEVQTLPLQLLKSCVSAMAELVRHYGATVLLCTATQPALGKLFAAAAPELTISEIAPDPDGLFDFFRRVHFEKEGVLSDQQLAECLLKSEQVLCVVNTRKRARDVFKLLPHEGSYHLSTLMTARDRESTLKTIRERLASGLTCRVVSTSLIEAGVDVDFPCVWREMTGLDSILQAAGRCNREGLHSCNDSIVHIFTGEGKISEVLRQRIVATQQVMEQYDDINTRAAINDYFRKLFWECGDDALDKPHILEMEAHLLFRQVANKFHMIDDAGMRTVYIPTATNGHEFELLRAGQISRKLMRSLARTAVSIPIYEYQELLNSCAVEDYGADGFGILVNTGAYEPECGLNVKVESGTALFF